MTDDILYASAVDLIAQYKSGRLSPVEATEAVLKRIDEQDGKVNAFILVDADAAMAAARAAEARWAKGEPKGLLDGVPTSIKDLVVTKGWPTLRGSRTVDPAGPWQDDAPCVARLREHGAVLLGKTTTPEFGWKGVTDSPLTGITRNPWNLAMTPGGSSGGASAALAAGMGPLAIGSDGGGSIRIPAGFTGVFGLKANFGRVPAWPSSPTGTLSHVGPMTRSVADAALMLTVIAEPDDRDWFSLPYQAVDYTRDLDAGVAGLRVAFSPTLGYAQVHPEVADRVARAAKAFEDLGAVVEEVDPGFDDPTAMFKVLWWVAQSSNLGKLPADRKALLEPTLAEIVEEGSRIQIEAYLQANTQRTELGQRMRQFHQTYDLLLTPSLAVPAFEAGHLYPPNLDGEDYWFAWTPFTYPFNLTQQPAASIPCGFTGDGMPVGLQIVAANFREDLVLRAARAYEAAHPITERPAL